MLRLSRLSRLISGISAWESLFLGPERPRQRHLAAALNSNGGPSKTAHGLRSQAAWRQALYPLVAH